MYSLCIIFTIIICFFGYTFSLTGHVCSRQKAETFTKTYDRAFICPQRYTTACGQLDWRRCTKYRVNTCFTPTEKYETRYRTVDECCPGWRDAGAGSCTEPVCPGNCQNGGTCVDVGGMSGCKCAEGFYGDTCEHNKNYVETWHVVLLFLICISVAVIVAVVVLFYTSFRSRSRINSTTFQLRQMVEKERLIKDDDNEDQIARTTESSYRPSPTAPLED